MSTSPESIQVWVVDVAAQNAQNWRSVLSGAEWERAMRFRMPADQNRFAVTRGVLRTLLGRHLHLPATAIQFSENENGKPAVAAKVSFNVSHSGNYALVALANKVEIGIDVERISGHRVVADLARRVLTPNEYERFIQLAFSHQERTFFQIWTLKESILKGIGSGFSVPPECVEVAFYPDEPKLLSSSAAQLNDVNEWSLRTLSIGDEDYAAAIAVKQRMPIIELRRFE